MEAAAGCLDSGWDRWRRRLRSLLPALLPACCLLPAAPQSSCCVRAAARCLPAAARRPPPVAVRYARSSQPSLLPGNTQYATMWRNLCLIALSSAVTYVEGGSPQNEALWKACGAEHPTLGYDGGVNAGKGDLAAVKAALAAGADMNAKQSEALGATCMMTAGANNYTDILLHLIAEGADLDLTGNTKRSTLMWATRWGHHDIVRLLLGAGADTTIRDTSHMDAEKIANAKGMTHIGERPWLPVPHVSLPHSGCLM
jgi:hypothetical protein